MKKASHGALMSGDMIGLVAFDFVLGIVFRSVMHMPLVLEVRGVDGIAWSQSARKILLAWMTRN
jgi:hypothetical protein